MSENLERVWNKINDMSSEISSVATRQRAIDDLFRRQDIYCTTELKRWDEMKTDIGTLNTRMTVMEERISTIISRLDSMVTLPWKLVAAMAGIAAFFTFIFKLVSAWVKSGVE